MICNLCEGDGWIAFPEWADPEKKNILIRKVACPRGCPLANPTEANVLPNLPMGPLQ